MTIFDTIRYPISDPPRLEELQSLPEHLYKAWWINVGWGEYNTYVTAARTTLDKDYISGFYSRYCDSEIYQRDITLLRKMIQEYNT